MKNDDTKKMNIMDERDNKNNPKTKRIKTSGFSKFINIFGMVFACGYVNVCRCQFCT